MRAKVGELWRRHLAESTCIVAAEVTWDGKRIFPVCSRRLVLELGVGLANPAKKKRAAIELARCVG